MIQEALIANGQTGKLLKEINNQLQAVEAEYKDDIIMLQFKVTHKETGKRINTMTFINVPLSQAADPNVLVL